mmetsp:Transcript_34363/g.47248  ORF Transcript_34363/g.47248 Transcript_34363/m.47248 type:complete len:551 (-) Transcript_34363:52-1704(-)
MIANFLKECKVDSIPEKETEGKSVDPCGFILIGGTADWDNQAGKAVAGLEQLHRIEFSQPIKYVFSSSSASHSFFVLNDGTSIFSIGKNDHGQLGVDSRITISIPLRVHNPITSSLKVLKISAGRSHSLFLFENNEVYGCGSNSNGQLGLGASKLLNQDALTLKQLPLQNIRDIACGYEFSLACDMQGVLYSFGHPEYGQLGNGSTGEYLRDSGQKGSAVQHAYVTTPTRIESFVSKDAHGKIKTNINSNEIRIRSVAAGKNHAICVEEWDNAACTSTSSSSSSNADNNAEEYIPLNRVFSWGFGGYGRLGHNDSKDEHIPREVGFFSHYPANSLTPSVQNNKQKQVRQVICGSTFSIAITVSKHMYFWGKMSNSPRGEATTYPKMQQELYDWPVEACAAGANLILVASNKLEPGKGGNGNTCIGWGQPAAGKLGFEGDVRSSTNPKFMTALAGLRVKDISCGYGHVCFLVTEDESAPAGGILSSPKKQASEESNKRKASSSKSAASLKSFPLLFSVEDEESSGKKKSKKNAEDPKKPAAKGTKAKKTKT